jgi:hypothetical protein
MSVLGTSVPTLVDVAKLLDPDGRIAAVAELLSQTNEMLTDMPWKEGNLQTGMRTTIRTGLPTVAWRLLNEGVQPSKSTSAQIDEACGKLEAWSEVDKALADLSGNTSAFRLSEATAFIEAMNQEFSSTFFYGNSSVDPEEFTGMSIRYSDPTATNGSNVLDAGSSDSDNTSIWLIAWGDQTIHGIYPKGSKAGLQHHDHGEETLETAGASAGGKRLRVYRDQFVWDCGIALRDWRYSVRIGSIDVSNLTGESSAADLTKYMIKALYRLPNFKVGRPVFYMNRTVGQMLDIQRYNNVSAGGGLSYEVVDGKQQMSFRGFPIRICDALVNTESAV